MEWIQRLRDFRQNDGLKLIQIDRKTSRGSYSNRDKSDALHIVGAWESEHGLALGQAAVDSKTNDITVIPQLLDMLDLRGAVVTIDAMGCQKSIAKKFIEAAGGYRRSDCGAVS